MKKTLQLPVSRTYLSKPICLAKANELVTTGQIDMNVQECAEEIYAHTVIYYEGIKIQKKFNSKIVNELINHANPIDLEDGGDTKARKLAYKAIWLI